MLRASTQKMGTAARSASMAISFLLAAIFWASPQLVGEARVKRLPVSPSMQSNSGISNGTGAKSLKPESGSVSENVYTNDFFGFTFEFPKGWSVQDEETKDYLLEAGEAATAAGDPVKKAELDEEIKLHHTLLAILRHPLGTPAPMNPRIFIFATDVSFVPSIRTGRDYLLILKNALIKPNTKVIREPTDCTFGGKIFSRMDFAIESANGTNTFRSHVATVLNKYTLEFLVSAESSDRLEVLVQTLNTLQFKKDANTTESTAPPSSSIQASKLEPKSNGVEILTPTQGVEFQPYIGRLILNVKRNWYALMPEEALKGRKGITVVRFKIEKGGNLSTGGSWIERTSASDLLDEAALNAIRASAPFENLPAEFHGPRIELRFIFFYNVPVPAK